MPTTRILSVFLILTCVLHTQDPPKFEVASVKAVVSNPVAAGTQRGLGAGGCRQTFRIDRGRVDMECVFLPELIGYAFRRPPGRIDGPAWMRGPGGPIFDLSATIPAGASEKQVPEMLQALLMERFQLAVHRGTKEKEVLALVAAKDGLKLSTAGPDSTGPRSPADPPDTIPVGEIERHNVASADGSGRATIFSSPRMGTVRETDGANRTQHWEASSISLAGLADLLDVVGPWEPPVIDATGSRQRFQLVFEVSLPRPGDPRDMEGDLIAAFNDGLRRLGLQLVRRKGSVETLVIDHLEKTPSEN